MYNSSIIIGRLVADPELRTTPNGKNVCNFRVAVDRPYKDSSGEKITDFIPCFCWGKDAENIAVRFRKGDFIGVDVSLQSRNYTDKEGEKRFVLELCVEKWFFVGSKPKADIESSEA